MKHICLVISVHRESWIGNQNWKGIVGRSLRGDRQRYASESTYALSLWDPPPSFALCLRHGAKAAVVNKPGQNWYVSFSFPLLTAACRILFSLLPRRTLQNLGRGGGGSFFLLWTRSIRKVCSFALTDSLT